MSCTLARNAVDDSKQEGHINGQNKQGNMMQQNCRVRKRLVIFLSWITFTLKLLVDPEVYLTTT